MYNLDRNYQTILLFNEINFLTDLLYYKQIAIES